MRINKFLAENQIGSRRKVEEYILQGRVKVNNKIVTDLAINITDKDVVTFDNKLLKKQNKFVYYKFNKPKGYICSASDDRGRKTIYDIVKTEQRLFSVGRLDYNTEGLLILTNDGEFANYITHPRNQIDKEYVVKIEGKIKESELAVLRAGVVVDGKRMPTAKVQVSNTDENFTRLIVTIHEGQNRQIRRMFEAIGKTIVLLKRVSIAGVKLGGLKRGEYKPLTNEELYLLTK